MLEVTEIFRSIQGESTFAGLPCSFVRLSRCNLRCRYCDTQYAWAPGTLMSGDVILTRLAELGLDLVEVTGGEPLLQSEAPAFLRRLESNAGTLLVETNGSLPLPRSRQFRAVMDVKCPTSGMADRFRRENLTCLQPGDELKFVVGTHMDFEYAATMVREHRLHTAVYPLLISPVAGELAPDLLAAWILESRLPFRLQLQLHKLIWPESERGR